MVNTPALTFVATGVAMPSVVKGQVAKVVALAKPSDKTAKATNANTENNFV